MQIVKVILKHILIPVAFGIVLGFGITVIFEWEHLNSWPVVRNYMLYSSILSLFFWKGSEVIIRSLNKRHSWVKDTKKLLIKQTVFTFLYSLTVIFLFYLYVWFLLMHRKDLHGFYTNFRYGFYFCFSITAIVTLLFYSINFFKSWKQAIINEERLKRESLALQYESLKNQVNPHFLFNSFNTLTSLIQSDQNASITYVKQLSDVFRYVLDQNSRELVPFTNELAFVDSYYYLQKIRFGTNFKIETDIRDKNFLVVPLVMQILIENAVKHNEISSEKPLCISIRDEDKHLVVSNPVQLRNFVPGSNQIGLKMLSFQYEFLCGEKVDVQTIHNNFVVRIPKIKNKTYAHSDRRR